MASEVLFFLFSFTTGRGGYQRCDVIRGAGTALIDGRIGAGVGGGGVATALRHAVQSKAPRRCADGPP